MCKNCKSLGLVFCVCATLLPVMVAIADDIADITHKAQYAYHIPEQHDTAEHPINALPPEPARYDISGYGAAYS